MKIGIVGNLGKKELAGAVKDFLGYLQESAVRYVVEENIASLIAEHGLPQDPAKVGSLGQCVESADILVAFGGDGTILSAARRAGAIGTPVLGINLGKLGFLAEVAPQEMKEAIRDLMEKRYVIEERSVLQGESAQLGGRMLHAVNDIVIAKGRSPRIISLDVHVDGSFAVTCRGDGIILSTPTGSTAYALSNGGPIVIPGSAVFGLTPISPHSLSGRPLIVPDNSVVTILGSSDGEEFLISADGQEEAVVSQPLRIEIRKAGFNLRLVRRTTRSYFDVLRAKLLWGTDLRSS